MAFNFPRRISLTVALIWMTLYATTVMAEPRTLNGAAAMEGPSAAGPAGKWLAEDIRGGGVIDRLQTVLEIAVDGAVTGTGGCNRMTGRATVSGEKIIFGSMASTRMACPPAVMDQERKFFDALRDARTWRRDPTRRKLTLLDAEGRPVIVLAQM